MQVKMGNGIVQVAAQSGLDVSMTDISDDALEGGLKRITKNLENAVSKGKKSCNGLNSEVNFKISYLRREKIFIPPF